MNDVMVMNQVLWPLEIISWLTTSCLVIMLTLVHWSTQVHWALSRHCQADEGSHHMIQITAHDTNNSTW